jgi:N-acetylglucosaminyldiphosphoundecaprenol N-acetyl-beta-D-mannosaminyltransferase
MADHVQDIPSAVLIGIGAAFDYLSGRKRQAPRWVQRAGMEWFFRLITEPRRLWRRYAQYPRFGLLVAAQLLGLTRYESESLAEAERLQSTEKRKEVSL